MARESSASKRLGTGAARRALSFKLFGEVLSELRRVTWPTREETMRLTLMVLAVSAAIGAFLGLVDIGLVQIFNVVLGN